MWKRCYRERLLRYGLEVNASEIEEGIQFLTKDGCIDFGSLGESQQREVVVRLLKNRGVQKKILDIISIILNY